MKRLLSYTAIRFLIAGGINTLFGLAVYSGLALTPLPTLAVVILTNIVGMLFNFMTSGGLVFGDLSPERIPRFVLCYVAVVLFYWFAISSLAPIMGGRIAAMAFVIVPVTGLTYLLQSLFVFRKPAAT